MSICHVHNCSLADVKFVLDVLMSQGVSIPDVGKQSLSFYTSEFAQCWLTGFSLTVPVLFNRLFIWPFSDLLFGSCKTSLHKQPCDNTTNKHLLGTSTFRSDSR